MSVSRIATGTVVTAAAQESVVDVARRMDENNVGTVVVLDEDAKPVGIVTDRDIAMRCLAHDHDPLGNVSVIMSRDVRTIDDSSPIDDALRTMASAVVRRLVLTGEGGRVTGVLSVDDVLLRMARETSLIGELLAREAPMIDAAQA